MKGLITAAGLGKRSMASKYYRKELFSIYDERDGNVVIRPILDAAIYRMRYAGVDDIYVVLDQEDGVTKKFIEESYPDLHIIIQRERKGYGYAVYLARDYINEPFVLNAGDGILIDPDREREIIHGFSGGNLLVAFQVDDPRKYGVLDMQGNTVIGVKEKPENPTSNLALAAFYVLDPSVFDHIDNGQRESELTPAIDATIKMGIRTTAQRIQKDEWISVGQVTSYVDVVNRTYRYAMERTASI
ncbi:nucleotidyltransferase family protein [Thermoplasma sp.]|uniref:nucleotidyltransferase family protein n=1 Tax=Thermoplasma sp. TaxID=1973142 RepID=UPI0012719605|nr:sugar phosphate nucleotidyltransferase [Thermoplasma sp.]KAA8922980.1 MAG: sugar nucleotidyltransferase [Thermoplasma sp.]